MQMPRRQGRPKRHEGPPPHLQLPPPQLSASSPQERPQLPQLFVSVVVLAQDPPQQEPAPQAFPQRPQFRLSVWVAAQEPPQHALPGPQPAPAPHWQTPALQVSPAAHVGSQGMSVVQVPSRQTSAPVQAFPHAPQLLRSTCESMHDAPQHACPDAHPGPPPHMHSPESPLHTSSLVQAGSQGGVTQDPASQTCPSPQTIPHAPQFVADSSKLAQPSSQHASPSIQPDAPWQRHWPDTHASPVSAQSRPQPPQFAGSVGSAEQPEGQQLWPTGHAPSGPHMDIGMHSPETHVSPPSHAGMHRSPVSAIGASTSGTSIGDPESIRPVPPCAQAEKRRMRQSIRLARIMGLNILPESLHPSSGVYKSLDRTV